MDPKASDNWRQLVHGFGSVVMLSTADYNAPLWTNKQHIASRLATEIPVLYVESLGLRRPRLNWTDLRRIGRRVQGLAHWGSRASGKSSRPRPELLEIASPVVVPFHDSRAVRALNRTLFALQLKRRIANLPQPRVLWTYTPLAIDIVDLNDFDVCLYHCVDDLGSVPGVSMALIENLEKRLVPVADVVVATSHELEDRLSKLNPATQYFHNVVDVEHFAKASTAGHIPCDLAAIPEPRAVFVGALSDHKIDWDLLNGVAQSLPNWSFVLIGPMGEEAEQYGVKEAARLQNVYLLGYRPYAELPDYLRGATVGLIPYRITKHTSSIFPMKVLEYLAAGLSVVSTRLPALVGHRDLSVAMASSQAAFTEAIIESSELPSKAIQITDHSVNTWDSLLVSVLLLLVAARSNQSAKVSHNHKGSDQ
jgi:glycosyltransferase involved in cell wall biosynthesis